MNVVYLNVRLVHFFRTNGALNSSMYVMDEFGNSIEVSYNESLCYFSHT